MRMLLSCLLWPCLASGETASQLAVDSLPRMDSLTQVDSLTQIDSLPRLDSLVQADSLTAPTLVPAPPPPAREAPASPAPASAGLPAPPPDSLTAAGTFLDLTLDQVVRDLLKHNPMVVSTRLEWLAADKRATASLGTFEPALVGSLKRGKTHYNNRRLAEETTEHSIGLGGKFPTGADWNVGYSLTDIRHGRNAYDQPKAFSGVTAVQPLLRGAWFGSPIASVRFAYAEREIAYQAYRSRLMDILSEVEAAYWNLSFSQTKVAYAGQSVAIARRLVEDSRAWVRTGKMSDMDLMEAEAGLASRSADLADARQEQLDAMNQLKLLLSSDRIGKESLLRSVEDPFLRDSALAPWKWPDSAVESLFPLQPEFLTRRNEVAKAKVAVDFQRDRALPDLRLKGSFGWNGFANTADGALYRLGEDPRPTWSAELQLNLPLFLDVEARGLLAAEELKLQAAEKDLQAAEYGIASSYRILRHRLQALWERLGNARTVVEFRERLLEVELKRLEAGRSSNRLIFETEEKLSEARQWALESHVRYRNTLSQLAKISGTLLRDRGLETLEEGRPIIAGSLVESEAARKLRERAEGK